MSRTLLSALLLLLSSVATAAPPGGSTALVLTTDCGPECQSVSWFQGQRARVDVTGAIRQTLLFDGSTGTTYRFVPGEGTYGVISEGEVDSFVEGSIEGGANGLRESRAQGLAAFDAQWAALRETVEKLPPDQRALVEEQLADARSAFEASLGETAAASAGHPWSVRRTGKKERVGHWDCELVTIMTGDVAAADAWLAPAQSLIYDASALRLGASMAKALGHAATSGWTAPLALKTSAGAPAVVVKANFHDGTGHTIGTMEIKSVEVRQVPPGHFDLPAGLFRKRILPP